MSDDRDSLPEVSFDGPGFDGPGKGTSDAIREAIAADLQEVAPRSLKTRLLHGIAATAMVGALTVASFGSGAWGKAMANTSALVLGAVAILLAVFLVSGAFAPQFKHVGRDTRLLVVAGTIAAWSLYLLSSVSNVAWSSAVAPMAANCAIRSIGAGIVSGAAFMWVWRKTDPWTPRLSGSLIGACAGILASAHVGIVCAGSHGGHLLVGHWIAVPLLAFVGFVASRRVLAP